MIACCIIAGYIVMRWYIIPYVLSIHQRGSPLFICIMYPPILSKLWYHLQSIQSRAAIAFYCVAFFVFMSVAVLPFTVLERGIVDKEVVNKYYHPILYQMSQGICSIPGAAILAFLVSLIIITTQRPTLVFPQYVLGLDRCRSIGAARFPRRSAFHHWHGLARGNVWLFYALGHPFQSSRYQHAGMSLPQQGAGAVSRSTSAEVQKEYVEALAKVDWTAVKKDLKQLFRDSKGLLTTATMEVSSSVSRGTPRVPIARGMQACMTTNICLFCFVVFCYEAFRIAYVAFVHCTH
jgi:hypothetical protein